MLSKKQLEKLFDKYSPVIVSVLSYYTSDRSQAKDWMQEIFIKVWEKREQIDPDHPGVKGYLITMARNHAIYKLKRQRNISEMPSDSMERFRDTSCNVTGKLAKRELSEAYSKALNQVPPRAKQAFTLSRDQGLTYWQIAEKMGISPKTVEVQISNTLRILRVELREFIT